MTRSRYGMIAGIAGAAFAWWYRKRRHGRPGVDTEADQGRIIYSNAPVP
jgi:hypothetical protein